jgi:DNA-directed RNA polymerase beta' subunit
MFQYKNPSRIIGIQFGISSPEEIRKAGVVEVVSKDTYINNKEVPGGLFDPRMGVLGPGAICPTDGLSYIQTPGYFGYIEMARPIFFIQHIKEIMKILKCVCFKCSKLLISKEQHAQVCEMSSYQRWDYVYPLCQKVKRCGEQTESGCGCKQPDKIKLDGMSTINAVWENLVNEGAATAESKDAKSNYVMKLTAEIVLKIFKRISDEDVEFMGFSATWSRPDWMICQVLPVAPPAVRPSVKMDANQRSEDDLTHIYGHIIKTNRDLMERINANASPHIIDNLTSVLQYFVAMIVNNKVKGAVPMAQRTGRPLQCITGRLNYKHGRIRGNLMGKRVDFSARSVITGDPNLSARQLGVPLRVAMCLTKPVVVNDRNRNFLTKLVQNGPETYPGAKILEKKDGSNVSLRYVDRSSIRLENGDKVHRHMMDGDAVLFNRQPSLHRMSMMCHIVKVMKRGDTFRMNVCDTKPYNADFDGDEMNMHMPQSELSEIELRNLAAIPYQIISPSSNAPIIGIFQDSMLGSYQFTRKGVEFTPRQAMNILMGYSNVDMKELRNKKKITNFDILSQITPPISLKYKTKLFDDAEDPNVSNNVLEIHNGKYIRGQADKGVFASGTKGILNRICNDFGNMACSNYIDDLQQIITEYMKTSAYSVGVSDLVSDRKTTESVLQVISTKMNEVAELTDKVHLGILENNSGKTNAQEFEVQVGNILNDATSQTGKIGVKSLDESNRFVKIVKSGSKGSMLNISQMISCLGQQSVDGKRVPYGFDNRTLPHFKKFDDSPEARGFVKNSYISGLTAPELFFHAMGGRMGLIDTAVKSVTWETPIVIIDESGKPLYTEIGRWIDGKLDTNADAVQHFDEKNMELLNVNNIYVPTTDEHGTVSWEEITAVTRHDPGTTLYEIKTLGGRSVTVTESKSLLIWNEERKGFFEMLTPEIRVGDCVPVTAELCEPPILIEKSADDALEIATNFHKGEDLNPEIILYSRDFIGRFIQMIETLGMSDRSYDARNEQNANILAMLYNRIGFHVSFDKHIITSCEYKSNVYKNNVVLDPIVEIVPIGVEKHPKMYDLTIPTTLNFGLANGLQVRDTSQTGYIQRRLVKGLEDLKVEYDGTVRNNMGKIIQFTYGEDGVDTTRVENQNINLVNMSIEDIYMYYDLIGLNDGENKDMLNIYTKETIKRFKAQREKTKAKCKACVDDLIKFRDELVANVFKFKNEDAIKAPVAFQYIIQNIQGQMNLTANNAVDITPLEFIETIEKTMLRLKSTFKVTRLFEIMYFYSLSPKELLIKKRFNTRAVALLMEHIVLAYKKSIVHPGEMVGVIAGQSIGEPTTQLTLNSFVYETEILVRNGAGEIKCVQIGDFTTSGIKTSRKLDYMEDKDTTYAELSEFYEVPSATEDGQTVWRKIEAVTKHPVVNEDGTNTMLKITTKGCRELIATKAKSFLKLVDGKIIGVEGKDLAVGDYLPVSKLILSIQQQTIETSETIPNTVNGILTMEPRDGRCIDLEFDKIVSIEEVQNTTAYAYDLTVEDTRNFDCANGLCVRDTFHLAGVATKSNVTRGVPRIEEILRLTRNPDKPSATVFLKPADQHDKDKAANYCNMIQHTKLVDVVKSVEICFDPNDYNSKIEADQVVLQEFYEFEKLVEECNDGAAAAEDTVQKSKWIIRMEIDAESLLDKNITMDDIHFAISNSHKAEVSCVFSDMNSNNLLFRIRLNSSVFKKKKGAAESLDQSDEIYLLKNFQDNLLNNIVLRGVSNITNVNPRMLKDMTVKEDSKYVRKDMWILDTVGSNLLDIFALDFIDYTRTYSNDIREMYDVLGIEAARQNILNEFNEVMEASDAYVNYHHLSILCDRMTVKAEMVPMFRSGIMNDDIGPISKSTYEMHTEIFLDASRHGDFDQMRGVSANVMCGQAGFYGTNAFSLLLDMKAILQLEEAQLKEEEQNRGINFIANGDDMDTDANLAKIDIENNIKNIECVDTGSVNDGYDLF